MICAATAVWAVILHAAGGVISIIVGIIAGWIAWQNRQLSQARAGEQQRNQRDHDRMEQAITRMAAEISTLKETRPRREEMISHLAAITQHITDVKVQVAQINARLTPQTEHPGGA